MKKSELQQLAARAAKGESAAWDSLYREISRISASVCSKNSLSREDAEDVSQETALAIAGRLSELAAMDNPEGYLRRVAGSKSVDIIRSESKTPVESLHEDEDHILNLPDANSAPENEVAGLSADRMIDDFIAELPEDQRVALIMRYYDGYTNAQIAKKLGVPAGTVASRIRYGKKSLEKQIVKYEKENHIRLHAKIAFPFLLWRMFKNQTFKTAEIIATDGGSSASGTSRAITGALAALVVGGAVIGTGFVFQGDKNPPAEEITPTQSVTKQAEPTAATVYEDIYETQVETLYNTVNSAQQYNRKTEQAEQNRAAPSDEFKFAGNRFERSENLLTSKTYHSDELGATLTFPDSWVNNVELIKNVNGIGVYDRGKSDNPLGVYLSQNALLTFSYADNDIYSLEEQNYSLPHYFAFGLAEFPGRKTYKYRIYECWLSWNGTVMNKTDLDYSNINRDVIYILESFRPDGSKYTSLLTQEKKDAVMNATEFELHVNG